MNGIIEKNTQNVFHSNGWVIIESPHTSNLSDIELRYFHQFRSVTNYTTIANSLSVYKIDNIIFPVELKVNDIIVLADVMVDNNVSWYGGKTQIISEANPLVTTGITLYVVSTASGSANINVGLKIYGRRILASQATL